MSKTYKTWHALFVPLPDAAVDAVSNRCIELGATGTEERDGGITAYFPGNADIAAVRNELSAFLDSLTDMGTLTATPEISSADVTEEDWAENWKRFFTHVRIGGQFLVAPPWHSAMVEIGRVTVVVEPGMAFGTGCHESTELVIRLLERFMKDGMQVLDVGTGTGILAIAAVKLGAAHVTAIDIEEESVEAARKNAAANRCETRIDAGLTDVSALESGTFDLITANINRSVLTGNAARFAAMLKQNGIIIVSGIEDVDVLPVTAEFIPHDVALADTEEKNTWRALAFRKI